MEILYNSQVYDRFTTPIIAYTKSILPGYSKRIMQCHCSHLVYALTFPILAL